MSLFLRDVAFFTGSLFLLVCSLFLRSPKTVVVIENLVYAHSFPLQITAEVAFFLRLLKFFVVGRDFYCAGRFFYLPQQMLLPMKISCAHAVLPPQKCLSHSRFTHCFEDKFPPQQFGAGKTNFFTIFSFVSTWKSCERKGGKSWYRTGFSSLLPSVYNFKGFFPLPFTTFPSRYERKNSKKNSFSCTKLLWWKLIFETMCKPWVG